MERTASRLVDWDRIDTVLVDMDGTLLDLAFDNDFWLELVPAHYARLNGCTLQEARERLTPRFDAIQGTLNWYCLDHWTRDLGFDVKALKHEHRHRVSFLPLAREFLAAVRSRGKRLWLVTNAHRDALEVKAGQTGIDRLVDRVVSSHDFRAPKESATFWTELARAHPFDPARSLFVEDSLTVLAAARRFGVAHLIAIRRPDSRRSARVIDSYAGVDGVFELV
jgi:putative hydrolase of the HAD superfamily